MLSTQENISTFAFFVFARFADYDNLKRLALRRGAKVTRSGQIGVLTTWTAEFRLRSKDRKLKETLVEHVADKNWAMRRVSRAWNLASVWSLSRSDAAARGWWSVQMRRP